MIGLVIALIVLIALIVYVASWVISLQRQEDEGRSEAVSGEAHYVLPLSIAEAQSYEDAKIDLLKQIFNKDSVPSLQLATAFRTSIPDAERRKLKALLLRRLMTCIEPMRKIRSDRGGINTLLARKLVSEQYVVDYMDSEKMMNDEIEFCMSEADVLEPGWSKNIFQQAVMIWRNEEEKKKTEDTKNK